MPVCIEPEIIQKCPEAFDFSGEILPHRGILHQGPHLTVRVRVRESREMGQAEQLGGEEKNQIVAQEHSVGINAKAELVT